VRSPRFQQLVLAAGAICNAPGFGAGPEEPERTRADKFARAVLRRRHRRLVRRAAACATGGPQERHALRIAAKKLRYAAEFFAPLFPGRHARAYAAALAGLQDVLGRGNDAATAARLAAELGAGGEPVDRALDAWLATTTAGVEPELARAWKRFTRAMRFWRKD